MQEKENILRILRETLKAIKKTDSDNLKNLSNQTIHTATIAQDPDNIMVSVFVYSIGKILERDNYKKMKEWASFYKLLIENVKKAIKSLEKDDLENFRNYLGEIRAAINVGKDFREYMNEIFYKASINKAAKLYEHGLSLEKVSQLLNVSLWDLSSYIGQGMIHETSFIEGISPQERTKLLENFLK